MEGIVGYLRRNFMVSLLRTSSWEELNAKLAVCCRMQRERDLQSDTRRAGGDR